MWTSSLLEQPGVADVLRAECFKAFHRWWRWDYCSCMFCTSVRRPCPPHVASSQWGVGVCDTMTQPTLRGTKREGGIKEADGGRGKKEMFPSLISAVVHTQQCMYLSLFSRLCRHLSFPRVSFKPFHLLRNEEMGAFYVPFFPLPLSQTHIIKTWYEDD